MALHERIEAKHTPGLIGINSNDIDPAGWAKADPSADVTEDDTGARGVDLVIGGKLVKRYNQPYYHEQEYISGGDWVGSTHFQNRHANAARIAACWNAAERAGLSTEALNAGVIEGLIEALSQIAATARGNGPYSRDRDSDTLAMIEKCASLHVAKATGGAL